MTFDPKILARVARCFCFLPGREVSAFKIYLLCKWANRPTAPTCDPDALAFLTYTQITDATISAAICKLVSDLKNNGTPSFWSRETLLYPMVSGPAPNNLSWRANLKTPGTYDLLEIAGKLPTYSLLGIQGNTLVSSYLNTQYSPAVAAGPPFPRIFYYLTSEATTGAASYYCGTWGNTIAISPRYNGGGAGTGSRSSYIKDGSVYTPWVGGGGDVHLGAYLWQRISDPVRQAARNADVPSAHTNNQAEATGGTTFPMFLFALDNVGTPGQYSNALLSGFSYGTPFTTDAEWLAYRGIWETFQLSVNAGRSHPLGV